MNQQPDRFFRNKLEGFQKPAPSSAWERIEAAQNKKTNKGLWLKFAASLLLLATTAYVLWPDATGRENNVARHQEPALVKPDETSAPRLEIPDTSGSEKIDAEKITPKKSGVTPKPSDRPREILVSEVHTDMSGSMTPSIQECLDESKDSAPELAVAATPHAAAGENITLVFTETDVNEYLNKKVLTEATDSTRKPSRWKKLLKKANDLTSNQDPFGELRQKKNEILALNFKSEKQRDQNK